MFGGRSFDTGGRTSAADLVDDWLARLEERAARSAALTATAHSAGGRVSVTVSATGAVTGLELAEAVREQPAADIAREILATLRAAQARLATLAAEKDCPESRQIAGR